MITATVACGPFGEMAWKLWELGWSPLPVGRPGGPPEKDPAYSGVHGHGGRDLDELGIGRALVTHACCNAASRMPEGVIGIDIDNYDKIKKDGSVVRKRGLTTLAELEERFGPLPRTQMWTARTGGSGIRFFRIPPGVYLPGILGDGIETIQRHLRYAIVPGSVNPETDTVYRSCDSYLDHVPVELCRPEGLPWLPDSWIEGLRIPEPRWGRSGRVPRGVGMRAVTALPEDEEPCKAMCTVRDRWLDKLRSGRHDSMRDGVRALVGMHADGHRGVSGAVKELVLAFEDELRGERDARSEWQRAVDSGWHKFGGEPDSECSCGTDEFNPRHWRKYGEDWIDEDGEIWEAPEEFSYRAVLELMGLLDLDAEVETAMVEGIVAEAESIAEDAPAPAPAVVVDVMDGGEDDEYPAPVAEFWDLRPELGAVRDWARARRVGPWSMLGAVLLRVLAAVPPTVVVPPLVGAAGSLNLFVAAVGRSGAGKDAALGAASEAFTLPEPPPGLFPGLEEDAWPFVVQPGSGEGIAHIFARRVPKPDRPKGSRETVVDQYRRSAILSVTEVDTLIALGARNGSTLFGIIRDLFGAASLGHHFSDPEKRLSVRAHSYRAGLWLGCQPLNAGPLVRGKEATGGTPQRILWLPTDDPAAPEIRPADPPGVELPTPFWGTAACRTDGPFGGWWMLDVPDEIARVVDDNRLAALHGRAVDPLAGHLLYTRVKVAAALAVLAGRERVFEGDWELAGQVIEISERTKRGVLDELGRADVEEGNRRAAAQGLADAQRESTRDKVREAALIRRLLRYVERAGVDGIPWKHLANRHLKKDERETAKRLLAAMADEGRITLEDRRYRLVRE